MIFRGLDSQGTVVYGPVLRAKAAVIALEGVPVSVRTLEIDYLQGSVVRGRGTQPVVVSSDRDTLVEDPTFSDVTYALQQIHVVPDDLDLRRGESQALQVEGSYADNTTADLTDSAQWSSTNTSVAEVVGSELLARGVGTCTVTSTVGSLSAQATVRVAPPQLQNIQLEPANATVLEGGQLAFRALGQFSDNTVEVLSGLSWNCNEPGIATISNQGLAHALSPGQCRIQASTQGLTGSTNFTVAVNETLTNLVISPPQLDLPKGLVAGYRVTASYANGTVVDVTETATLSTDDLTIAKTGGAFHGLSLLPPLYSQFALQPPPFFPGAPNEIEGVRPGTTQVKAQFQDLSAQAPITVVEPVPLAALVTPVESLLLEVGGSLQLGTLTGMSDGTRQTDRADVNLFIKSGTSTAVDAQRLLTALRAGVDFLGALVPPLPNLPQYNLPARFSYGPSVNFGYRQGDYFQQPYEETVAVVNQPLGLTFASWNGSGAVGTLIEDSSYGLIGADYEPVIFTLNPRIVNRSTRLRALAGGKFVNSPVEQIFFAGRRVPSDGADYGVAIRNTAPVTFPPPPYYLYTEFSDAPQGIADAVVADFDGNGLSDAALVTGQQLRIRLSQTGVLDRLLAPTELGIEAGQIACGDLNKDQRVDLVVGRPDGLQVFLGEGNGGFAARPLLASPELVRSGGDHLALADIDGDSNLDVTYMYSKGLGNRFYAVAYGDGSGGLGRAYYGTTGFRVSATALGDITGDGRADLVTVQSKSQQTYATDSDASVSIHPGSAQGFLPQQVIQLSSSNAPSDVVLRDVNADGRLDITISLTAPTVSFNTTYGKFSRLLDLVRQAQ